MSTVDNSTFFVTKMDPLADPVRNTRWRFLIPQSIITATGVTPTNLNAGEFDDEFALLVKSHTLPTLATTMAAVNYMGFESQYPVGQEGLSGQAQCTAQVLEDGWGYEMMLGWNQAGLNTGVLVPEIETPDGDKLTVTGIGRGLGHHKDTKNPNYAVLRNNTIKVQLYDWMYGKPILTVTYINAYPMSVAGFELAATNQAALAMFNFTLRYDRWTIKFHDYKRPQVQQLPS